MGILTRIFGEPKPTVFKMIEQGDIDSLRAISKIDKSQMYYCQPLVYFAVENCQRNMYSIVEYLIHIGCDIDARDTFTEIQETPLSRLGHTRVNRINVAQLLLQKGAKPNARGKNGSCALHGTAFTLKTEMVDLLIAYKADINLPDWQGHTVLHKVGYMLSNIEVDDRMQDLEKYIQCLLKHGARPDITDVDGHLPGQLTYPQHEKVNKVLRKFI